MIFFFYEPKWPRTSIVLYVCIYLPIMQVKRALLGILAFMLCRYHHPFEFSDHLVDIDSEKMTCSIDLSMRRFGDLKSGQGANNEVGDEEACSVCLVEFESEDMVSQLSKCGHIYHTVCIDKWVEGDNFTCPLCRSLLLNVHGGTCHASSRGIST